MDCPLHINGDSLPAETQNSNNGGMPLIQRRTLHDLNAMVERTLAVAKHVRIDAARLEDVFPPLKRFQDGWKHNPTPLTDDALCRNLATGAVNYCFWVGKANNLPAGGGSSLVWKAYEEAAAETNDIAGILMGFSKRIAALKFPLQTERMLMLHEITQGIETKLPILRSACCQGARISEALDCLISLFPYSYGQDPFLKRACLMLEILHEETEFATEIETIPIPADYQDPKVLQAWGVLCYSDELNDKIQTGTMIPKGHPMEMEIRAATIRVGALIYSKYGIPAHITDRFIWMQRKYYPNPYHLTVTTDY
jgi:Potential Queuosine, Q, salvage protein family